MIHEPKGVPELRVEVAMLKGQVDILFQRIDGIRMHIKADRKAIDEGLLEVAGNLKHFMQTHKMSWLKRLVTKRR